MSYILDALRKADAQRERDPSRGIHAHPAALGAVSDRDARAPWAWGAGALVLVAIAAAGWYVMREQNAPASVPAPVAPVVVERAPAVARVAPVVAAPVIEPPAPPVAEVVPPPPPGPSLHVEPPANPPVQPPVVSAAAAAPTPVPAAAGLPADAPRISISGGVYSTSPAQRMLIVNGQVLNEGSEAAPGLTIAEIKPRTAVLKFRGALYTVAY
jgi:general secretion pathway protein B